MGLRVTEDEFREFLRRQGKLTATVLPSPAKKPSKWKNEPVTVDGQYFASKGEYRRHCELLLQEKAGLITDLKRQVSIPLVVNDILICTYRADWVYWEKGEEVVEDYKGALTDIFTLKKNLVAACYGKEIRITTKKG